MKSTRPVSRGPRSRRRRRTAPARDRPRARREAHSFEPLEGRFLLSDGISYLNLNPVQAFNPPAATLDGSAPTSRPLPLPADVIAQLPSGPRAPSSAVGLPIGPFSTRDDSYTLDAGGGLPIIHVDLTWPEGPGAVAGHLIISDASGRPLYDVPLDGVTTLDAQLPIPSGGGLSSILDVGLQITYPGPDTSSTGSYQIQVNWDPSLAPIPTPPPASTPAGAPAPASALDSSSAVVGFGPADDTLSNGTTASPTPSQGISATPSQGISATRDLPAPFSSTTIVGPSGPAGGLNPGSVVALSDPGLARAIVIPSTPPPAAALNSGLNSSSAGAASPSFDLPLASGSGSGSSTNAGGARPAVVGPLPLSGSSPDGGIFAYPYGKGKERGNDTFRPTLAVAGAPDPLDAPDAPPRRRSRDFVPPLPPGIVGEWPSIARPFEFGTAAGLSATGVAFLPALGNFAEARVVRHPSKAAASRWPILHARIKPKTSLAALFAGSAGLFLGLVAPDCVTRLAHWQDDRRWKRQATFFATSKRKPNPVDDLL